MSEWLKKLIRREVIRMKNQNNGRLQAIIEAWGDLPEAGRAAIHALATSLLDLQGYQIAGRMIDLLTYESPNNAEAAPTPG